MLQHLQSRNVLPLRWHGTEATNRVTGAARRGGQPGEAKSRPGTQARDADSDSARAARRGGTPGGGAARARRAERRTDLGPRALST
jgi:hypothetical protein